MLPHQKRVVDEKAELNEKLNKLRQFFLSEQYYSLDREEMLRLQKQAEVMQAYSDILSERISHFEVKKAAGRGVVLQNSSVTYPSHPDVPRPTNERLKQLAYELCIAIEKCGASPELTKASSLASDLHAYLSKPDLEKKDLRERLSRLLKEKR